MNFLKKKYNTEQENFWSTKFGNEYTSRNLKINKLKFIGKNLINSKIKIKNAIELGANIGLNLDAIKRIYPKCKTYGVEINYNAYKILEKKHLASNVSILEFIINYKLDLVILSSVLIYQNLIFLNKIY